MTATAANILEGKTAYVAGAKVTGTMVNLSGATAIDYTSSNQTPVIAGDAIFFGDNTDGVRRGSVRYSGNNGYLQGNTLFGFKSRIATVTPSASAQTVSSDSTNGILEKVTVNAVTNLSAANIKKGVTVGGVAGTYDPASFTTHTVKVTNDWSGIAGNNKTYTCKVCGADGTIQSQSFNTGDAGGSTELTFSNVLGPLISVQFYSYNYKQETSCGYHSEALCTGGTRLYFQFYIPNGAYYAAGANTITLKATSSEVTVYTGKVSGGTSKNSTS